MSTPPNRFRRGLNVLGAALDTSGQSFAALQNRDAEEREAQRRQTQQEEARNQELDDERREVQREIRDRLIELCQDGTISPEQCEAERAKLDPDINAEVPSVISQPDPNKVRARQIELEQAEADLANTRSEIANRKTDNDRLDKQLSIQQQNANTAAKNAETQRIKANTPGGRSSGRPRVVKVPSKQQLKDAATILQDRDVQVPLDSNPGETMDTKISSLPTKDRAKYILHVTSTANQIMATNDGVSFTQALDAAAKQADSFIEDDTSNNILGFGDDIRFNAKGATEALSSAPSARSKNCVISPRDGKEYCKVNGQWTPTGR